MNTTLAVLGLGGGELVLVMVVILILFGAKRIPEFAKGLGKGINEFKKASREVTDSLENENNQPAPQKNLPASTTVQSQPQSHPPETKVV